MCTAWLDGAHGVVHHLAQNLDFAVVAAADIPALRAHARARGWDKLRLLSAASNSFKYASERSVVDGVDGWNAVLIYLSFDRQFLQIEIMTCLHDASSSTMLH